MRPVLRVLAHPACRAGGAQSGEGEEEQVAAWRALLADARIERTVTGVRCVLPIGQLAATAELAAAEQACCPFFGFQISLRGDVFALTIRCPDDALPLLGELTGLDMPVPVPV